MKNLKALFSFGGEVDKKTGTLVGGIGAITLLLGWFLVTQFELINPKILPNPVDVLCAFPRLLTEQHLVENIVYTVGLNFSGYLIALSLAIPFGFLIGIYPLPKALFRKYIEAFRYLPLPTVSGIFIAIFGLGFGMKSSFLAFGILIFTLPAVVQKVLDLQGKDKLYLQAGKTIGMSKWQLFRYVYWPYVMDRIYGDIRSLVAISYTYVVIAECLNKEGGIGAAISTFTRQSRTPEIYALLFIIVLIGVLQDWIFGIMEPKIFKYKK